MIVASVVSMCAISVVGTDNIYLAYAEYAFCGWFTLELVVRFVFCPSKKKFFTQFLNWIDFISIVPYYGQMLFNRSPLGFLRVFRLIRIFRIFRFFTFTSGLQIIVKSLKASSRELFLLVIILLLPVAIFSSIMYEIEKDHDTQPHFKNIPETFWWAIITMTTVGYGDMTPHSILGRCVGGVCALCGVIIVALPVSVIGNNFNTYYTHAQARLSLPKKKRRLIMAGDMNQLARLQVKSTSSLGSDRITDINNCLYSEKTEADEATTRKYRRYHRRSRNTLFAGGGVYIGAMTLAEGYDTPRQQTDKVPTVGGNSSASLPRNFRLINTTHESEEYIEQETKRKITEPRVRDGDSSESCRASTGNGQHQHADGVRTASSGELEPGESPSHGPRLRSSKTFRSKVTPSPVREPDEGLRNPADIEMTTRQLPAVAPPLPNLQHTRLDWPADAPDGPCSDDRTKGEYGTPFRYERRRNCLSQVSNGHVA